MSEQVIGNGANIFIIVVALVVGFAAGMGYIDYNKTKKSTRNKDIS